MNPIYAKDFHTKTFAESSAHDLDVKINSFLDSNPNIKVVDVKYQFGIAGMSSSTWSKFTAMILYVF